MPSNRPADSPESSWFLGLAAYERGDTKRALALWQQLLDILPPDSEAAHQLKLRMEQARQLDRKR
jgi:cytochrome c-type biogenesis protein CcmH/NrfG